jgi:hypothetical protein
MPKKSGKRGNSEGSITKRADGRWMARVSLPDGGRKSYYGKTRQEVSQKLLQAHKALSDGLPLAGERQTVQSFLELWLQNTAAQNVRPKTWRRYSELVNLHINPGACVNRCVNRFRRRAPVPLSVWPRL